MCDDAHGAELSNGVRVGPASLPGGSFADCILLTLTLDELRRVAVAQNSKIDFFASGFGAGGSERGAGGEVRTDWPTDRRGVISPFPFSGSK